VLIVTFFCKKLAFATTSVPDDLPFLFKMTQVVSSQPCTLLDLDYMPFVEC